MKQRFLVKLMILKRLINRKIVDKEICKIVDLSRTADEILKTYQSVNNTSHQPEVIEYSTETKQ